MSVEVTCTDTDTGDTDTVALNDEPSPRNFVLTCGPGCVLTNTVEYANGGRGHVERVRIGADGDREVRVPREFSAVFDVPSVGIVRIAIACEEGRARITHVEVSEIDGQGVAGLRAAKVPVAALLERAVTTMAYLGGAGVDGGERIAATASRRRVSDDRLQGVADAYERGGVRAVMTSEHVGERQAYRLVTRSRDAGLIPKDSS